LADVILRRSGDARAGLLFEDREWSWAEVVEEMRLRALLIRETLLRDLLPGHPRHVGVLLDNVPEYVFLLGGAALAGAVVVGVNTTRRGAELARDITSTDCHVVLTDGHHEGLLEALDLGIATDHVVRVDTGHYSAAVGTIGAGPDVVEAPRPGDLVLLVFTSGSTTAPKAVRVSQRTAADSALGMGFQPDDVLYCPMPLFHGNALKSCVFPALGSGATLALKRRFSASDFLPDVRRYGCTFSSTVGRALSYILATPATPQDGDNRLRVVLAPESSPTDVTAFRSRFGCHVITGYGSSENAIVLVPRAGQPPEALGVPLDGLDVAVVDSETLGECPRARFDGDGRLLNAADAIGEIVGRNALDRFEGYYDNPEATGQRARGGWYWSGDLGYRDERGVFFFAGRTDDWLRVDGENFAAAPVERLLERYPGVTGVAVFGVPDERTVDDQVMAVLELGGGGRFDAEAFDVFLAGQRDLGGKWSPRYVRLSPELPVGVTNKIDKRTLRGERWNTTDPVWWRPQRRGPLRAMTRDDRDELEKRFAEAGRSRAVERAVERG
jgi:fatty-acyl-CoA synthase